MSARDLVIGRVVGVVIIVVTFVVFYLFFASVVPLWLAARGLA